MANEDPTRNQARHLLAREASLAELYGRLFERAVSGGDLDAARRWNREYRLSPFRCQTLGALVRTHVAPRPRAGRPTSSAIT